MADKPTNNREMTAEYIRKFTSGKSKTAVRLEEVEGQLKELTEEYAGLIAAQQMTEDEKNAVEHQLKSYQKEKHDLEQRLGSYQTEMNSLIGELGQNKERVDALTRKSEEYQKKIDETNYRLTESQGKISNLTQTLSYQSKEVLSLEEAVQKAAAELGKTEIKLDRTAREKATLQAQFDLTLKEKNDMAEELNEYKEVINGVDDFMATLENLAQDAGVKMTMEQMAAEPESIANILARHMNDEDDYSLDAEIELSKVMNLYPGEAQEIKMCYTIIEQVKEEHKCIDKRYGMCRALTETLVGIEDTKEMNKIADKITEVMDFYKKASMLKEKMDSCKDKEQESYKNYENLMVKLDSANMLYGFKGINKINRELENLGVYNSIKTLCTDYTQNDDSAHADILVRPQKIKYAEMKPID